MAKHIPVKHSEGPVEVEGEGQAVTGILSIGDNKYIAKLTGWAQPIQDANAKFLAAAWDMESALFVALDALYQLSNGPGGSTGDYNEGGIGYDAIESIRAALTKANGEDTI